VIGGGIQGTCVAMELATRGVEVELFDAGPALMEGASRHSEGKVHLGFVYANDPTFLTPELMARGAAVFAPLMRRWLGSVFDTLPVSTPFNYAVHRASLLSPAELEDRYRSISQSVRRLIGHSGYFGVDDPHHVARQTEDDHDFGPEVDAVFTTREVAVDPGALGDLVSATVADAEGIRVFTDTRVTSVDVSNSRLVGTGPGNVIIEFGPYDHIVNCSWGGRPALDITAGLLAERPWTFRMKYFFRPSGNGATKLPSTTVVLGPFGDVVDYGSGRYYLSWYPIGRMGWSGDLVPPDWPTRPDTATAADIASATVEALAAVVPGVAVFAAAARAAPDVRGGVIFSWGNTDVEDRDSEFHRRSDVGLRSLDSYHSVDTGKSTTAPLFAVEVADRICRTT